MDSPAPPPVTADLLAAELLLTALNDPADAFGAGQTLGLDEAQRLSLSKLASDLLVKSRLAKFSDDGRTVLELTNAGRYWAQSGGWMAFLKEEPPGGGGGRNRSPETEAMRTEFMRLRLRTFWWSFGFSVAGFILSLISLTVAAIYGSRMLPP